MPKQIYHRTSHGAQCRDILLFPQPLYVLFLRPVTIVLTDGYFLFQPDTDLPLPAEAAPSTAGIDYESVTLMRMRQAERERLEREILEQEANEWHKLSCGHWFFHLQSFSYSWGRSEEKTHSDLFSYWCEVWEGMRYARLCEYFFGDLLYLVLTRCL